MLVRWQLPYSFPCIFYSKSLSKFQRPKSLKFWVHFVIYLILATLFIEIILFLNSSFIKNFLILYFLKNVLVLCLFVMLDSGRKIACNFLYPSIFI